MTDRILYVDDEANALAAFQRQLRKDFRISTALGGEQALRISNNRTGHAPLLGFDHVHHYVTDPARDWDGLKHGFLELDVQLTLSGCNVFTEPLRRRRARRRAYPSA